MLKLLGEIYSWFWYHTEIWIADKLKRRPYTYIMRDWIFTHGNAAAALALAWIAGMITLSVWHGTAATISSIVSGLILGHLVWGSRWIQDEQEYPPYNPDDAGTLASSPAGGSAAPGAPGQPPAGLR